MAVPSTSELCVLKALWKQQPLSTREIHDTIAGELGWTLSSTRKTVERMLEKGMLRQSSSHGVLIYTSQLEKVGTLAAFARDFGRRVMELDAPLPVTMFTGSKLVDAGELAALEQMLKDWPDDEAGEPRP